LKDAKKRIKKDMMKGMDAIWEDPEQLEKLMNKEKNAKKLKRLQMLYLIRSKKARNRKAVANLLGVNRETVGDWMTKYERGGIKRLLEIKEKSGKPSSLPKEVIEGMRKKLEEPKGVKSYKELLIWVQTTFAIITTYWVIYYTATQVLNARLAVARKSHIKKKKVLRLSSKKVLSIV